MKTNEGFYKSNSLERSNFMKSSIFESKSKERSSNDARYNSKTLYFFVVRNFILEIHAFSLKNSIVQKYSVEDFNKEKSIISGIGFENEKTIVENPKKKLKKMQERLFFLWDKENIPFHHREIFVESFKKLPIDDLINNLECEISKFEKKCSLIQVGDLLFRI